MTPIMRKASQANPVMQAPSQSRMRRSRGKGGSPGMIIGMVAGFVIVALLLYLAFGRGSGERPVGPVASSGVAVPPPPAMAGVPPAMPPTPVAGLPANTGVSPPRWDPPPVDREPAGADPVRPQPPRGDERPQDPEIAPPPKRSWDMDPATKDKVARILAGIEIAPDIDTVHAEIAEFGDAALPALIEGLGSENSFVRVHASQIIAEMTGRNPGADYQTPPLEERMKHVEDWKKLWLRGGLTVRAARKTREFSSEEVAMRVRKSVTEMTTAGLLDKDQMILDIKKLGKPAVPVLIECLSDENTSFAQCAHEALQQLTRVNFGSFPTEAGERTSFCRDWEKWWRESGESFEMR